jgi:hypothetical protein
MLNCLKKISSLRHLKSSPARGQIATLLILFMVAILIFILATANIGTTTITSMRVTTAADTASLQLASGLATMAHQGYISLGNAFEKCRHTGILAYVVGALAAIALIVVTIFVPEVGLWLDGLSAPALIALFAGLGALAGGISLGLATHSWSGAWRGAYQGAQVAAAIGGGVAGSLSNFAAGGAQQAAGAGLNSFMGVSDAGIKIVQAGAQLSAAAAASAITLAIVGGAAQIYSAIQADKRVGDGLRKSIRQIPDSYIALREGVFYTALSQIVTDQHTVTDVNDIDGDGDSAEQISAFDQWFYDRTQAFKENTASELIATLRNSLDQNGLFYNGSPIKNPNSVKEFINQLARWPMECNQTEVCAGIDWLATGISCPQGPVTELCGELKICTGLIGNRLDFYPIHLNQAYNLYERLINNIQYLISGSPVFEGSGTWNTGYMDKNQEWIDEYLFNRLDPNRKLGTIYTKLGYLLYGGDILQENGTTVNFLGLKYWLDRIEYIRQNDLVPAKLVYGDYYPDQPREVFNWPPIVALPGHKWPGYIFGLPYDPRVACIPSSEESCPPNTTPTPNKVYPCVWEKVSYNNPVTGVFVSNYPSRISPDDKIAASQELDVLRNFIDNPNTPSVELVDLTILNNSAIFAALTCAQPPVVSIRNIALIGDRRYPCSWDVTDSTANLTYEFQVSCDGVAQTEWLLRSEPVPGVGRYIVGIEEGYLNLVMSDTDTLATMKTNINAIVTTPEVYFATTDKDLDDEFKPVVEAIEGQVGNSIPEGDPGYKEGTLNIIRRAIDDFIGRLAELPPKRTDGAGKLEDDPPYTPYIWTSMDGNLEYSASVETGPFKLPSVERVGPTNIWASHECLKLMNYCDNTEGLGTSYACPSSTNLVPHRTFVTVTLDEPAGVDVTSSKVNLGKWNPFRGFSRRVIRKRSYPYFTWNTVGLSSRR